MNNLDTIANIMYLINMGVTVNSELKKINIPKDLHHGLKVAAAQDDLTLQEYVINVLKRELHGRLEKSR